MEIPVKKLIFVLTLLTLNGCATQSFLVNNERGVDSFSEERRQNFFVSGLGQKKEIDATEICGDSDKILKVESRLTFLDAFLGVLTHGIYTPRTANVYCRK